MLDPCHPCMCLRACCEQCMFGYHSTKENHEQMKKLITQTINGEKPNGQAIAKHYMDVHPDWAKEMKGEK